MGCGNDKSNIVKKPIKIQMIFKMSINQKIISIKELSYKRLGVLTENNLLIYNSNNFRLINTIKIYDVQYLDFDFDCYFNFDIGYIINFIESQYFDLIVLTNKKIIVYQLCDKEYKIYQIIDERESLTDNQKYNYKFKFSRFNKYRLTSIIELSNGNLVSCSSDGLKIYYKNKNKEK